MARDLEADLKLCGAATEGPWVCSHPFRMSREPAPNPSIVECDHPIGSVAHCYGSNFTDADFIAAAREGWPETIRELMEARKRIAELESRLEVLTPCGDCDGKGWVYDPEDGGTMCCPECGA